MKKSRASYILRKSLADLQERQGQITVGDLEKEVINLACLEVLRKRRAKSFSEERSQGIAIDMDSMLKHAMHEPAKARSVATTFAEAAQDITPKYTQAYAENAKEGVPQNCSWDGMWNFLKNYFREKHDRDITSEQDAI